MKYEVNTNIETIDLRDILANVTNKAYWKKKWHIFEYDNVSAVLTLDEINIRNESVQLRIDVWDRNLEDKWYGHDYNWTSIPLAAEHYNLEVFRNGILGTIGTILRGFERKMARATPEYDEIREREVEMEDDHRNELIELLNDEGVENEEIREAYLDQNEESFKEESDAYIESFVDNALSHVHNMVELVVKFEG